MILSLKVIPILQAFSSVIFCIYGASRIHSASAELLTVSVVEVLTFKFFIL